MSLFAICSVSVSCGGKNSSSSTAKDLYEEAFTLEKSGDEHAASVIYKEIVLRYPDSEESRLSQAKLGDAFEPLIEAKGEKVESAEPMEADAKPSVEAEVKSPMEMKLQLYIGKWVSYDDLQLLTISSDSVSFEALFYDAKLDSSKFVEDGEEGVNFSFRNIGIFSCKGGGVSLDSTESKFVKVDPDFQLIDGFAMSELNESVCEVGGRTVVAPSVLGLVELKDPSLVNLSESRIGDAERLNGIRAQKNYRLKTSAYRTELNGGWGPWRTAKNNASFEMYAGNQFDEEKAEFEVDLEMTLMTDGTQNAKWTAAKPYSQKREIHLKDYVLGPEEHVSSIDNKKKPSAEEDLRTVIKYIRGRWKSKSGLEWEFVIGDTQGFKIAVQDLGKDEVVMDWTAGSTRGNGEPVLVVPGSNGSKINYIVRGISDTHVALQAQGSGFAGFMGAGSKAAAFSPNERMKRIPSKTFILVDKNTSEGSAEEESERSENEGLTVAEMFGETSANVPESDQAAVLTFVKELKKLELAGDWEQLEKMYGQECQYWGRELSAEEIVQDKRNYSKKWVTRKEEIIAPMSVTWGEGSLYCDFTTRFEMTSVEGDKRSGQVVVSICFQNRSGDEPLKIWMESGKVTFDK